MRIRQLNLLNIESCRVMWFDMIGTFFFCTHLRYMFGTQSDNDL